ncbi:MAG: hypothetical protein HKL82_05785 [Acidimicrobiaceae bacterium]|nr:hypothetical protein [Acidimicrobiaceae bacterium]
MMVGGEYLEDGSPEMAEMVEATPAAEVEDTVEAEVVGTVVGSDVESGAVTASPMEDFSRIGDPGRQLRVVPRPGPLTSGVADTEIDFFSIESLEIRACSSRGLSHRHAGTPRQDAFCLAAGADQLVVAVADGVSQGKHSQYAARAAVEVICTQLVDANDAFGDFPWGELAESVSNAITEEAIRREIVVLHERPSGADITRLVRHAMSTTAVAAVIALRPDENGVHQTRVAVLAGDSGAYQLVGGVIRSVAGGKDEDGSGLTHTSVKPLPGPAAPSLTDVELHKGEALILTSDGIGDPLGDGSEDLGSELATRWAAPPTATEFFNDVNFLRRTYDDDRTAVVVWVVNGR